MNQHQNGASRTTSRTSGGGGRIFAAAAVPDSVIALVRSLNRMRRMGLLDAITAAHIVKFFCIEVGADSAAIEACRGLIDEPDESEEGMLKRMTSWIKRRSLFMVTLFAIAAAVGMYASPPPPARTLHVITLQYAGDEVVVAPGSTRANIGDTIRVQSPNGEFSLALADGRMITSTDGRAAFTVTADTFGHFACTMYVDGETETGGYGGDVVPDTN